MEGRGGGGGGEGGRRSADNRRAAINRYRRRPLLIFCPEKWGGGGRPVHGYRGTVANRRENTRSGRTRSESRRKERKKKACLDKLRTYKRDKRRYLRLCRRVKVQAEKSFSIPECSSSSSSFLFFFFFASKQRFRSGISGTGGGEERKKERKTVFARGNSFLTIVGGGELEKHREIVGRGLTTVTPPR